MFKKISNIMLCMMILLLFFFNSIQAQSDKTLYFSSTNGKLYYSVDGADDKYFLVYNDMMPKKTYTDTLTIQNNTLDTYNFYMRFVDDGDLNPAQKKFLKKIHFKIYYQDKVIYDGSADGANKSFDSMDMASYVTLGSYNKNETKHLRVETTLNIDSKVEKKDVYYEKDKYDAWVASGYASDKTPIGYETQQEAQMKSDSGVTFVSQSKSYDENNEVIEDLETHLTWQFYATKEEGVLPEEIKPAANTSDILSIWKYCGLVAICIIFGIVVMHNRKVLKDKSSSS